MQHLKRSIGRVKGKFFPTLDYRGLTVPIRGPHVIRPILDQLTGGHYEMPEIEALQNILKPGDRLLEIGVGLGVVSGLAAVRFPDISIECYEANPELIDAIHELHELNGIKNIDLNNAVLVPGQSGEERDFFIPNSFAEGSLVNPGDSPRSVKVQTVSFQETLERFKPDVLVVDIEGGESELLSQVLLTGVRALVLEFHPMVISRTEEKDIFDNCIKAGLYPRVELSSANVVVFESVT